MLALAQLMALSNHFPHGYQHKCISRAHENLRASSDPSFPVHDSGSNLCWGWLGPAYKTINQLEKSSLGINSRIPYRAADDVTNRSIVYT